MTAIVPFRFKTKKSLKLALLAGEEVFLLDPTPWEMDTILLNKPEAELSPAGHFINNRQLLPGQSVYCTNHPKRSWFAQVTIKPDGSLKVS